MNSRARVMVLSALVPCMTLPATFARAQKSSPFCAGKNCAQARDKLMGLCDFIFNTATALSGRAMADILSPDIDARW